MSREESASSRRLRGRNNLQARSQLLRCLSSPRDGDGTCTESVAQRQKHTPGPAGHENDLLLTTLTQIWFECVDGPGVRNLVYRFIMISGLKMSYHRKV
jgi:hypothetical protein